MKNFDYYSVQVADPAPMKGYARKEDWLDTYYENEGQYGIGSTKGNQYAFMQEEDPCMTCNRKPYCAEANAICLAFAAYVDTGKFSEEQRGKPVVGGYDKMLESDRPVITGKNHKTPGTWTKNFLKDS